MTDELIIDSVHAKQFGGLTNRHLEIPPMPMVVIHGRNETGKSTFAELITWLLVGPSANGDVIRSLGKPGHVLGGVARGRLRGREFAARGDFKINPAGESIHKSGQLEYELDGLLDRTQWREHLGGIDRAAVSGIYRLWGQQLHEGGDADTEMRRAGLGAIAMSLDPREMVKKLLDASRPVSKIGSGNASFSSLSAEVKDLARAIGEARNNVDHYERKVDELAELERRSLEFSTRRRGLDQRGKLLSKLRELDELRGEELAAQVRLRECEAPPEPWLAVVDRTHRLRGLSTDNEEAEESLGSSRSEFHRLAAVVGTDPSTDAAEVVCKVSITLSDTASVATAVSNVGHARAARVASVAERDDLKAKWDSAESHATRAVADLGVGRDRVGSARLDAESKTEIFGSVDEFTRAQSDLAKAEDDHQSAEVNVAGASEALAQARRRWDQLGLGVGVHEWRELTGSGRVASRSTTSLRRWVPMAVLAVAALLAGLAGQWLVLVLVAAAAIAVVVSTSPPPVMADDPAVADIAEHITIADLRFADASSRLAEATKAMEGARQRVASARAEVRAVGLRLGIDLPDDPLAVREIVSRWSKAAAEIESFEEAGRRYRTVVRETEGVVAAERSALADLDSLLTGYGLPGGIDVGAAEASAKAHAELAAQARAVMQAETAVLRAKAELTDLLGPVADEVAGWRPRDVADRADELLKLKDARDEAAGRLRKTETRIADFVGHDDDLEALIHEAPDPEQVEAEIAAIDAESQVLERQARDLAEQTGVVKSEIKHLENEQRLADLRLREGSIEEARREVGFEAASRRLAAVVLEYVADQYERENQPELIRRTEALALTAAREWRAVEVRSAGEKATSLMVQQADHTTLPVTALSTGARALLYLSLRVAMAEHDTLKRGLAMPLICDDPLIHIDDERAEAALGLLRDASAVRQVVLFTCHDRTVEVAESIGVTTHRI